MLTIIQSDPEVPLGAYAGYLAEEGVAYEVFHAYAGGVFPRLDNVSAVVVLGGAMGVHDEDRYPFLSDLKAFIEECVRGEIPFLGICLGGQLLADVLGGKVTSNACGEKGTLAVRLSPEGKLDPLFSGVPEDFVSFQWHNDSFAIPAGALALASSAVCPAQAFRFGDNAYGFQFHPEVDGAIVRLWASQTAKTADSSDRLVTEFIAAEGAYRPIARRMLINFLKIAHVL